MRNPVNGNCEVKNPIQINCKKTVTELEDRLVDALTPQCKDFRGAITAAPGLCQTASNLSKAQCDVFAAHDAVTCQAEQDFNNALARNPFAEVHGNAVTHGTIDASAAGLSVADDFGTISASLTAKGSAHINSHIDLRMKKATIEQVVCNPTWSGDPKADVTVDAKDVDFGFTLQSHEVADDKLKLAYETPDEKRSRSTCRNRRLKSSASPPKTRRSAATASARR